MTKRNQLTARNFPTAQEEAEGQRPASRYLGPESAYRLAFTDNDFLLRDELRTLGAEELRPTHGGVFFAGDWSTCYRANLESRIATRILWHIVKGPYAKEEDIYRLAVRQLWPNHFAVSRTMRSSSVSC